MIFVFIILLFFADNVRAESAPIPNDKNRKTITVRASVSLTPEFVFSIKKNSSLKLEKATFALGEEVNVKVKIVSANGFPLRGHKIILQSVSAGEKTLFTLSGETDNDGLEYFSFSVNERLLGKNILRVVDITYDEPITISQEKIFIVYKPSDGKRNRELANQKIIIRKSAASKQISFDETEKFSANDDALQNNGTIDAYGSTEFPQTWSNDP